MDKAIKKRRITIAAASLRVVIGFLLAIAPIYFRESLVIAAESKSAGQTDCDKTVKAAEQEGGLSIYMTQAFEPVFREAFQKKYPKIRVTTVTGRGFELSQRIMNERRADKYIADLYISGNITPLTVFHRAKILEPIKPLLILPEVLDTSGWFEGKHHYDDAESRYTVKELLGHKTIAMTNRYTHLAQEHKAQAAAKLRERIQG